jgi:DNA-directed RNA polymerase specialized sigma24 family protein
MLEREPSGVPTLGGQPLFTATHWSVVLAATNQESPDAAAALDRLCRAYWYPLYAYVRRQGYGPADAQDLTQEFFARFLARKALAGVAPEKGKFRSFLLVALRHLLSDRRDRASAAKRGGGREVLSLDAEEAEGRYRLEPVERLDAEKIYERRWAMTLLGQAWTSLREESAAQGKLQQFERLAEFVAGEAEVTCVAAASELGLTESAMRSAVHRLRERYRALIREEIALTVSCPSEVDEELRHLIAVMRQ